MHDPARDMANAAAQQQAALQEQFVSEHMRRIFLLIYRMVGNVADAQDLTQEVFIKALQRGDQLKDAQKAAHWLSRIASNTAIDFMRRHGRVNFADLDAVMETTPGALAADREMDPERLALRGEKARLLEAGLATLTVKERTALLLRDVEDVPAEEVARQMNCSMATVRSHIANARVKFRKFLERRQS
jgi:RNA polymerase sigma-70 factor, ECF subfamily